MPAAENSPNERSRAWPAPTRKRRLLLPLAYMTAIFALSSIPDTETPANALESALRWVSPELQNCCTSRCSGGWRGVGTGACTAGCARTRGGSGSRWR